MVRVRWQYLSSRLPSRDRSFSGVERETTFLLLTRMTRGAVLTDDRYNAMGKVEGFVG